MLTQKSTTFVWGEAAQEAFQKIKERIGSKRTLAILDPERHVYLQTDPSSVAWAAVVSQAIGGSATLRTISFISSAFMEKEQNWDTSNRELAAIVFACKKLPVLLKGRQCTVLGDCYGPPALYTFPTPYAFPASTYLMPLNPLPYPVHVPLFKSPRLTLIT